MKINKKPISSFVITILLVLSIFPSQIVTAGTPTVEQVNDYSLQVAQFIREKCHGSCKNVILLGDDYVIPSFRRDIRWLDWYIPFTDWKINHTDKILTDIPYVQRKAKTFAEFDKLFVKTDWMGQESKGKDVIFIVPDDTSPELNLQINRLGEVLKNKNLALDIKIKQDNEVTCNDPQLWNNFNGVTLFVFGIDNQALNCFPFVDRLEDTAFIDINPWDGRNYAVILQTVKPEIIQMFKVLVEKDGYKKLQSEWITFVDTGLMITSIIATFVGADIIVDSIDTAFQCVVVQNAIACGASAATIAIEGLPSGAVRGIIKKFTSKAGEIGEKFLLKYGDESFIVLGRLFKKGGLDAIDTFGFYLKKLGNYFSDSWDNIARKFNWGAVDEVLAAKGAKRVGSLDNFAPHLAKETQADLIHTVGKVDEALKLGDNAVTKMKFVDELIDENGKVLPKNVKAIFIPDTGEIHILKGTDPSYVKNVLVPHEMAHAKIFESLSPEINKMLDKEILEEYEEFLVDNLAKEKIAGYYLDDIRYVSDEISVQARYAAISMGQGGFEKGAFDIMAKDVALTKLYSPDKYKIFENALQNSRVFEKGPQILELANEYVKSINYLELSSNSLTTISEMTNKLRGIV